MDHKEKPRTPEEELEHVGVLGMKWGVHRSAETHQFNERFRTNKRRSHEIDRARLAVASKRQQIRATSDPTKKAALKASFLKNPDRATALRMKRGEKFALAILTPAGPIGLGIGVGLTARVGARRNIEESLRKK